MEKRFIFLKGNSFSVSSTCLQVQWTHIEKWTTLACFCKYVLHKLNKQRKQANISFYSYERVTKLPIHFLLCAFSDCSLVTCFCFCLQQCFSNLLSRCCRVLCLSRGGQSVLLWSKCCYSVFSEEHFLLSVFSLYPRFASLYCEYRRISS